MITALLLASAPVVTAVDAERAFISDAQHLGQWTAFRKWAQSDAVMFTPQVVWAQDYLKNQKDPPKALDWAPADSWVSCDGRTAINTGPWISPSKKTHGYFTTVWTQTKGTWRWGYDGGDVLAAPMAWPKAPVTHRASCSGSARIPAAYRRATSPTERLAGKPPADAGQGRSADGTLIYEWKVSADGARTLTAKSWNGRAYRVIIDQQVAAPPK